MAGTAGRNLSFTWNSVDYSADLNDVGPEGDMDLKDTTTFGASVTAKSYTPTLADGKLSLKGPWVAAFSAAMWADMLAGTSRAWVLGPAGTTTGFEKISGSGFVKSVKTAGKIDDVLQLQIDIQVSGVITYGTYP